MEANNPREHLADDTEEEQRARNAYLDEIIQQGPIATDPSRNILMGAIFERFFPFLVGKLVYYTRFNITEAEDLAAYAMEALCTQVREDKIESYRLPKISNWLVQTGKRKGIDIYRHEHYVDGRAKRDPIQFIPFDELIAPEKQYEYAEELPEIDAETLLENMTEMTLPDGNDGVFVNDGVEELLTGLSKKNRQMLILRFVYDFSPKEVAEYLGISPREIGMRMSRASAGVRERIRNRAGDEK